MNKILFILPGAPLAFNHSGAASRYAQNFFALKNLDAELHVVRFHIENQSQKVLDFELSSETAQNAKQYAASWLEVEVPANQPTSRWDVLRRALRDPVESEFPQHKYLAQQLMPLLERIFPQLIWAEHSDTAAAISFISPKIPWVYSQHDMRYIIRANRAGTRNMSEYALSQISRRVEIEVIQQPDIVITGSITEEKRLREIGCAFVSCIPMIYPKMPSIDLDCAPMENIHVVHVGSLETTANRKGLIDYLSKAHLSMLKLCTENHVSVDLVIIGDASRTKFPLNELLLQQHIVLAGYVSDLSSVLRPYDIAILPYTQDSGYRTKLPLLMGYAQVIVATRAAVAGSLMPGLEDVCVLLDCVEDFPDRIAWLSAHLEERQRLGLAGRLFAEQHFSFEAVRPLYVDLMRKLSVASASLQE